MGMISNKPDLGFTGAKRNYMRDRYGNIKLLSHVEINRFCVLGNKF